MSTQIAINCPYCGEQIIIIVDDNGNVISTIHKENKLKQATKEQLQNQNIEFGIANNYVKEGEIIKNE